MKSSFLTKSFIEKARKIHGWKFDYSKVIYINNRTKIIIICPIHGEFEQLPYNHLIGKGCPKCGGEKTRQRCSSNIEEFTRKAKLAHGNKNDYSKFVYINNYTKGCITCLVNKDHGEYWQTPNNHLHGKKCPKCKSEATSKRCKYTLEEFVKKANIIHNNKYGYKKFIYINSLTKGIITCDKHGDFGQSPGHHLQGKGCPVCCDSKGEIAIRNILLKHSIEYLQEYKIPLQNNNYKYDFFLPDCNLFIEFHGGQHYFPIDHFGGEENFNKIQFRDKLKLSIAKELKYKLLIIPHTVLDNNTPETFEVLLLSMISKKTKYHPKESIPIKEKWYDPRFKLEKL